VYFPHSSKFTFAYTLKHTTYSCIHIMYLNMVTIFLGVTNTEEQFLPFANPKNCPFTHSTSFGYHILTHSKIQFFFVLLRREFKKQNMQREQYTSSVTMNYTVTAIRTLQFHTKLNNPHRCPSSTTATEKRNAKHCPT
jgi:hypothetical protein